MNATGCRGRHYSADFGGFAGMPWACCTHCGRYRVLLASSSPGPATDPNHCAKRTDSGGYPAPNPR